MTTHETVLELAAAAIDFDLDDGERAELDRHIAGCDACRRTAAAFRDDAAAIASGTGPRLSAARSATILAGALRPQKRSSPLRLLAVAALVAVLSAGLIVAGMGWSRLSQDPLLAVVPSRSPSSTPGPSSGPTATAGPTAEPSVTTPRPGESPPAGALPVRGSGQEVGTQVRMAPAAGGDLYASIPVPGGTVLLALLDSTGRPRAGWPVVLAGATSCEQLLPVDDGSVRVICTLENPDGNMFSPIGAFAFESTGRSLPGWPVVFGDHGADGYLTGRVIDDQVAVLAWVSLGDVIPEGEPTGLGWIMAIAADGTVRSGSKISYYNDCCRPDMWAIGPDGIAYGTFHRFDDHPFAPKWSSDLRVVRFDSDVPGYTGYPGMDAFVTIEGIASKPAFDAAGRIHVTVNTGPDRLARTLAFDTDGEAYVDTSGWAAANDPTELGFTATDTCVGIEGTCEVPAPPLVGPDGSTFVIGAYFDSTIVADVWLSGEVMQPGWPYRSDTGHQGTGFCAAGDICETYSLAMPALGPDNVLYLIHRAANASVGGSIVAVLRDGRLSPGWPVELTRPGAEFWSVVVGADGTAYALAIEPESGGTSSASILAIAPDSTVLWTTTIIEP